MNRVTTNLAGTLIAVIVFFFLGRLFFLSDLQADIVNTRKQIEDGQSRYESLQNELARVVPAKSEISGSKNTPTAAITLLKPGEESSLLRHIAQTAGKSFRINSFNLIESFMIKPEMSETMSSSQPNFISAGSQLPELDEHGMPVGLPVDDDEEWPGVEIVPARIEFSTTYRTLGKFLSYATRNMPLSTVRSLDIAMRDSGLIKGVLVMNFPLTDGK